MKITSKKFARDLKPGDVFVDAHLSVLGDGEIIVSHQNVTDVDIDLKGRTVGVSTVYTYGRRVSISSYYANSGTRFFRFDYFDLVTV